MSSMQPPQNLRFGHDEVELNNLLLGHGEVSDYVMTMRSQKAFCSSAAMPPTQP